MDSTEKIVEEAGEPDQQRTAMTGQQRRFAAASQGSLADYRDLVVGSRGWGFMAAFEAYNLFLAGLGGLPGLGLRSLALRYILESAGKGLVVGRGVTFRQPHRISIGRSVVIDDYAVIDIRRSENDAGQVAITIGDHALIGRGSIILTRGGSIALGKACNISSYCRIATQSRIEIGQSVLIAAYAYIGCGNHRFSGKDKPIMEQEMELRGGVTIGSNSWIGARATILDGVRVGNNVVIGAHSFVREDVPDNAVAVGSPARIVRYRG